MTPYLRKFPQADGSTLVCEARRIDGVVVRMPNRIIKADGTEANPTPVKEPRRIAPKRTMAQKAATFARSAAKHVAAGMPQVTDEQVAERFAICQACPHYIPQSEGRGECSKCGCGIKAVGVGAGISKLRWADQSCPIGRWKPFPPPPPEVN